MSMMNSLFRSRLRILVEVERPGDAGEGPLHATVDGVKLKIHVGREEGEELDICGLVAQHLQQPGFKLHTRFRIHQENGAHAPKLQERRRCVLCIGHAGENFGLWFATVLAEEELDNCGD